MLPKTAKDTKDSQSRLDFFLMLEPTLQSECIRNELYKVTTLKEWIEHVRKIDERLTIKRKRYRDIFMEEFNLHTNKYPALGSSRIPNATANSNTSSSSSTQKPFTRLPKPTDGEKDLLRTHSGCFKCRKFNAGHQMRKRKYEKSSRIFLNLFLMSMTYLPTSWQKLNSKTPT